MRTRAAVAALAAVPLLTLGIFFLYPVAGMVARGLWVDGNFAPGQLIEVLSRSRTATVVWFTVWSAGLATLITILVGLPVAYALHRLSFPGVRLLRALVLLPFVMPTVVIGVAFRQLFSSSGPWGFLGLDGSAPAIVTALVFFNVSVLVRTVGSYWEGLDPRMEQAAAVLGAPRWRLWWDITLPQLWPSIVAAATIVFLFCATAFGVVLTMGGVRYANIETEIYHLTTQELDLSGAAALSLLQLLVIIGLLAVSNRSQRRRLQLQRSTAVPRPVRWSDAGALAWTGGTVVFVLSPIVALLAASLQGPHGWTLQHYVNLTQEHATVVVTVSQALANSLYTAAIAAIIALTLGVITAGLISRPVRGQWLRRWQRGLDGLIMLPLGVSAVTLGFGFLITLARPPLALRDSPWLVPIAQALVALPLVVRALAPLLTSIDHRQREVAATMGASPIRVLLAVDVPLARRALIAAFGFAFAVSLGEFGATSFLARAEHPTLPVLIYRLIGLPGADNYGMAMAAAVVLAAATTVVIVVMERISGRHVGAF